MPFKSKGNKRSELLMETLTDYKPGKCIKQISSMLNILFIEWQKISLNVCLQTNFEWLYIIICVYTNARAAGHNGSVGKIENGFSSYIPIKNAKKELDFMTVRFLYFPIRFRKRKKNIHDAIMTILYSSIFVFCSVLKKHKKTIL